MEEKTSGTHADVAQCSFYLKNFPGEDVWVFTGPRVNICFECFDVCFRLMNGGTSKRNIKLISAGHTRVECSFCGRRGGDVSQMAGVSGAQIYNESANFIRGFYIGKGISVIVKGFLTTRKRSKEWKAMEEYVNHLLDQDLDNVFPIIGYIVSLMDDRKWEVFHDVLKGKADAFNHNAMVLLGSARSERSLK